MLSRTLARWNLGRWRRQLPAIERTGQPLAAESDDALKQRSLSLRYRAKSGESPEALLPEAFALMREAASRSVRMRHFDVQLIGGMAIAAGSIAEMQTGEGKTLTATLPLYLHALAGRGAHLATVNDYLARRDADLLRPAFALLGMTVGVIETDMSEPARRAAYGCDVTYGTGKEFGFDFLRDRLAARRQSDRGTSPLDVVLGTGSVGQPMQRAPHFMLVDEADSVLIDDASTPLVISAATAEDDDVANCFRWSASVVPQFVDGQHLTLDHIKQHLELTAEGRQFARSLPKPEVLASVGLPAIYEYLERAIRVERLFLRDRHYVIRDDKIEIVDEFTGRVAEGRKWRDGVHQAVEAKEGVKVTSGGGQAARVTVQDFFLRYPRLAGMTGTAATSASELARIYKTRVIAVPTNRPAIREQWPTQIFATSDAKWQAIVDEVQQLHAAGRPVLIGTRSIDKSEQLSQLLKVAGIEHAVLNARNVAQEAEIVAAAGEVGKVTVATNMAGRGTDIKLGPGVAERGGLHVVCTELHDAARIDRQLVGRCGRQGDPGSWRQYLALEDDILLAAFGPQTAAKLRSGSSPQRRESTFYRAQRRIEGRKFRQRRVLLYYENERQRSQREMGLDPYLDTPG